MDNIIIIAISALGGLGLVMAIILYFIANKFKVFEDPKIDEVDDLSESLCLQEISLPKNSEPMTVKITAYGGPGLRRATRLGSGRADKYFAGTPGLPGPHVLNRMFL